MSAGPSWELDLAVDRPAPLTVVVVGECDLVVHGLRTMLAPYAERVVLLDEDADPSGAADIVLYEVLGAFYDRFDEAATAVRWRARAVVYTWDVDAALARGTAARTASGHLSKMLEAADLLDALERIHLGERVVARASRERREAIATGLAWPGRDAGLSRQESQILSHITAGISNHEVAERTGLSLNTVKSYVRSTYRKIDAESRAQAVLWAVDHGFRDRAAQPLPRPVVRVVSSP